MKDTIQVPPKPRESLTQTVDQTPELSTTEFDGATQKLSTREQRMALEHQIEVLTEDIALRLEKDAAIKNSIKDKGDIGWSNVVHGVETTPQLIEEERHQLETLKQQVREIKSMKRGIFASLKNMLNL